jgi:hypothetical protein
MKLQRFVGMTSLKYLSYRSLSTDYDAIGVCAALISWVNRDNDPKTIYQYFPGA